MQEGRRFVVHRTISVLRVAVGLTVQKATGEKDQHTTKLRAYSLLQSLSYASY